jgi:uncharacterized protein (TIGR02145 family)
MKTYIRTVAWFFVIILFSGIIQSCISLNDVGGAGGWGIEVSTMPVTYITYHSAMSGVQYAGEGGSWGLCLDTALNPTISDQVIQFAPGYGLSGPNYLWDDLIPGTIYHVRAFTCPDIPSLSTQARYGSDVEFKTGNLDLSIVFNTGLTYGTLADIDGNSYKTIQIGTQTWMAENLRVTKYQDGSNIPYLDDKVKLANDTIGAFCYFQNSKIYRSAFGCLYNYYAVANKKNLCPIGWHVPDQVEWTTLTSYLGGDSIAGGKLKEAVLNHWDIPNTGATNESGFSALPGGSFSVIFKSTGGDYTDAGTSGQWWSVTASGTSSSLITSISDNSSECMPGSSGVDWSFCLSIRCIKENR